MTKHGFLAVLMALAPVAAHAQGAVIQAGPVAPGHVVLWGSNGVVRDGGSQVPPGVLPKATTSALGAVIVGSGLGVATSGNLSVTYGKAGNTALQGSLYGVANGVATLDGSGLLPAAQLPFPGVSALGGAQALTAPTHQFLTGLGTNGVFTTGQPAAGDISGLGSMATQNAGAVAITGGTLNGVSVGATTPGTGAFTTLGASGAVSLTGAGTALSVTNNASIGGTLGVTGATTLGALTVNGAG
ncbi:MAG TPA: hypothetical protein VN702_15375, partial [Acetobacteraceae bacterium]|nr:hypothetical protein [Acetobacteraceae bacterium]